MTESIWDEEFSQANNPEPQIQAEPTADLIFSEDLTALIELGKLEETIAIGDRKILIRTLTIGEELEIGLLTKRFRDTNEAIRAEITATVAASIQDIDGMPLAIPLGPSDNLLQLKFEALQKNYYWPVIRLVYQHYNSLSDRAQKVLEELDQKKD